MFLRARKAETLGLGQIVISNNIAFFSQTGGPNNGGTGLTLANCTFENPCGPTDLTDLGASTLNSLLPNTQMYFNGGAYDALNVLGGTSGVTLQSGQSVSSRTADYSQPATGAGRSTFNGAFILNNNNTLNNIILLPTSATIANGVVITGGTNNVMTGSQIGSAGNRYNTGVMINSSQLNIINSSIFGSTRGIRAETNSSLLIQNSQIDSTSTSGGTTGISLSNSTSNINNSQIFATAPGSASGNVIGINALNNSTISSINGSTITTNLTGVQGSSIGLNTDGSAATQQMTGGNLSVSGTGATTVLTQGPNITLSGVTCLLNGVPTAC